jgi:hypothetical protein
MASRPMPHSFATFADEWGRYLTPPPTQYEKLRRYEFGLEAEPGRQAYVDGCRVVDLCPVSSWGPMNYRRVGKIGQLGRDSSATLCQWQLKRFRNTLRTSAETAQTLSCGRRKKLRTSSRCTMATIALRNRPSRNCRLRLKPWPKREKLS